ncbi:hypothetical protein QVD17_10814 [Tagetes erecta]|uniref:Uncharacterized protein n=1 Tax=Tagetes erecta TaxID=13708 RepID=A0AAD8L799_TARER|nr:hypothetical protein QVD17_10814 [Tagetes erecta]
MNIHSFMNSVLHFETSGFRPSHYAAPNLLSDQQEDVEADDIPTPRKKFVNTMRGSCFSEINFDDLPFEFSHVKDKCKLEEQCDKGGSKTVGEVITVKTNDIKDASSSRFDMDKYVELQNDDQLLFEKWRNQKLTNSGRLLLCRNMFT